METLMQIGVAGATPFVLQFVLDFLTNGDSSQITLRGKMALSILTGGVLGILMHLYSMGHPTTELARQATDALNWFFVVVDGCISGAMATAGVSLALKVADRIGGK